MFVYVFNWLVAEDLILFVAPLAQRMVRDVTGRKVEGRRGREREGKWKVGEGGKGEVGEG